MRFWILLVPMAAVGISCEHTKGQLTPAELADTYDRAKEQYLAGRYEAASLHADRYLKGADQPPRAVEARRIRAQSRLQLSRYTSAAADFQEIRRSAKDPELRCLATLGLGHAYFGAGRYREALLQYERVRKMAEKDGDACLESVEDELLFAQGICLQCLGRWKDAEDLLFRVWRSHSKSRWASAAERRAFHNAFSIQVGAYSTAAGAEVQREAAAARGLNARIQKRRNAAGTLYVVIVGFHRTFQEAVAAKARVAARLGLPRDGVLVATSMKP